MVADGLIPKDQISFQALKNYFDAHPDAMDKYLWLNERTVFFTERPGGPFGSLNVPVTPFCSIATDKKVYPPAMLAFVSVPIPLGEESFPAPALRPPATRVHLMDFFSIRTAAARSAPPGDAISLWESGKRRSRPPGISSIPGSCIILP